MEFTAARTLRAVSARRSKNRSTWIKLAPAAGAFFALIAVAALDMTCAQATTGVGAIPGAGGVSATGAATYAIPIALPPGTHGMQPSLALVYNSQSGDGIAGYGWTLSGLSAISRCNKNYDDDGQFQAVQIAVAGDTPDDFCLDGQRLRSVSAGVYQKEIEDFSVITSYGANYDPTKFTIQTKDGRTYEYGNTPDSQIVFQGTSSVRTWALDKVTDASGDFMTFTYGNSAIAGVEYYLASIAYTGNGSTAPDHTIEFDYVNRSTATIRFSYVHGSLITLGGLLTAIKVHNGTITAQVTTTYNLTYNQDPANGRNRLATVQQCGTHSDCLPTTTVAWTDAQAGWTGDVSTGVTVADQAHTIAAHLMDVDGDGIDDLVYPDTVTTDWVVMFGKPGGGFTAPVDSGVPLWGDATYYQYALAMDYNGDGRMDLMVPIPSGWEVLVATGNRTAGVGGIFRTPPNSIPYMGATNSVTQLPIYEGNVWMADFSGGQLADMFDTNGSVVHWQQNEGPSTGETFSSPPQTIFSSSNLKKFTNPSLVDVGLDFDGSGRAGALLLSASGSTGSWVALTTLNNTLVQMASITGINPAAPAMPVDANSDGLTDLYTVTSGGQWQLSLSTGKTFNTLTTSLAYSASDNIAADYYADGRQVAVLGSGGNWQTLDATYNGSALSIATTLIAAPPYVAPNFTVSASLRVGHIEANGLDDLVYAVGEGNNPYTWHYALHAGATVTPGDLVTKVTDGFGNYCKFQYASLSSGSPTYTQGVAVAYPTRHAQMPMQVVSTYTESDGTGGSYNLTYSYANAAMETQGHGFLGFGSRTIVDSRNSNKETITYDQDFPFTGMMSQDLLTASDGTELREIDNSTVDPITHLPAYLPGGNAANHTDAYYPFFGSSVTQDYDNVAGTVQGTRIATTTIASTDFDGFGNLRHEKTVISDLTQAGAQYQTEQWFAYPATSQPNNCFGLPDSATITRTVPAGSLNASFTNPATRSITNAVDRTSCRLNSQTVSDGTNSLTTAYPSFDAFGNITETDVSGTGIPATRVTTDSYQAGNNEFPVSVTHVISATDSITSASTWNYAWGIKASDTDPNGNLTTYTPDDFGRPASVVRADGSGTTLSYDRCPGSFCPSGAQYAITTAQVTGTTNILTGYTAYDMLGRPIEEGRVLLGGVISKVDTTYNSLGDVSQISKPYTGSQAQYTTSYTYDATHNRIKEVDAPQDANDNCAPCQDATTVAYSGFTITTTQAVGDSASSSSTQVTSQTTDALGEVLNTVDTDNGSTSFNYDAFGDLVATQDADGKLTTMNYDGLGHKTGMADPNMGSWNYEVDALGEITCQTDAKGQSIIMSYDNVGRLISKLETAPGAGCNATTGTSSALTYDTQTKGVGLPAAVTDSNGFERDYAYDALSRPSDITTTPGAGAAQYTTSTTYDSFGRVQTVAYPASVSPTANGAVPTAAVTVTTPMPATAGNPITLDGSGSTDPNGLGLQYQWSETGPTLNAGSFDPAAASISFTPVAGGIYNFQLQVIDSSSALSAPASASVTVKPAAYTSAPSISPNPTTNGSVTLSWSAATNVDSYNVYMSTDNVNFTLIQNLTGLTTTVTGLTNGTYYFAIGSVAGGVNGDQGPSASELVTLPPGVPTKLNVTVSAILPNHNYTITWVRPGYGIETKYIVEEDNNSAFSSPTYITVSGSGSNPPATSMNRSQAPGTWYYQVKACNQTACSNYSNVDSVLVEDAPSVPTLSASPLNVVQYNNTTLSWSPHSSPVTSYVVQASGTSTFASTVQVYSGSATSTSFEIISETFFRVQACNGAGCSGWSGTVDVSERSNPGDGCNPICKLVMDDTLAMTETQPSAPSGVVSPLPDTERLSAAADLATNGLQPVTLAAMPRASAGTGTLAILKQERQRLVAASPAQPSEVALQTRFNHLASPAPGLAFAARGRTSLPSTGALRYAPPIYRAYADAHLQTAGGTPYRFTVQYNYDPASGALLSVSNADTGFIYWRAATDTGTAPVDAFGHIVGYVDGNNVSTVSAYDAATGAIQGISTGTGASSAVQSLIYTWDGFGNLKQRCDTNKGLLESFGYDGINRLANSTVYTGATYSNSQCSGGTAHSTLGMNYDAVGNITTRSNTGITVGSGTLNDTYAYGDPSHPYAVTGVTSMPGTYVYDANGNMTSGNGRTITWNDDNLPVSISSTSAVNGNNAVSGSSTFSYGPDLRRYQQVTTDSIAGNSTTLYIGGLFEVVSTSGAIQYRHNIVAAGGVVAVHTLDQSGNAMTAYIHADHLGSSDTITDDTGTVVQQASFDAFGLRRNPNDWSYNLTATQIAIQDPSNPTISDLKGITDRGYTSQEQLDSVGLVHMNGRVYDPSIGKMISTDPTIPNTLYSQAFNRYLYVYGNPLAFTDPSGYTCQTGSHIAGSNGGNADCTVPWVSPDYGSGLGNGDGGGPSCPGSSGVCLGTVNVSCSSLDGCTNLASIGVSEAFQNYINGLSSGFPQNSDGNPGDPDRPDKSPTQQPGQKQPQNADQALRPNASNKESLREMACELGNQVADVAAQIQDAGTKLEVGGLAIAGTGALFGQPEIAGVGAAVARTGGYISLTGGAVQFGAGLLQGFGGGSYQNAYNAAGTLGMSRALSSIITGPSPTSFLNNTAMVSGGLFDLGNSQIPQLGPQQVSCPH